MDERKFFFRSEEEVVEKMKALGIDPEKTIVHVKNKDLAEAFIELKARKSIDREGFDDLIEAAVDAAGEVHQEIESALEGLLEEMEDEWQEKYEEYRRLKILYGD